MDDDENVLSQAKKLFADGDVENSLDLVRNYWLENPDDGQAAALLSELMRESGRSELSKRLSKLSEHLPLDKKDTPPPNQNITDGKPLFEAGYSLIDARQHELAAMLLSRAAKLVPDEPTVNYELSFALMSMKKFEQAIPYLEQVLNEAADFDTLLNLFVCYVLTRQLSKAQDMLQRMSKLKLDAEQKKELQNRQIVFKRLEGLAGKSHLNARDWLYILYGSVLLRPTTRQEKPNEDVVTIGVMLAILKGVLEGLSVELEAIEFYSQQSRPLAQALAEFLEIPLSAYKGPGRSEQILLVMTWASDIIGPHKTFMTKQANRSLFSYSLAWDEPLPVVPDVVGCLSFEQCMPWRTENPALVSSGDFEVISQSGFPADIDKSYKDMLAHARDLESEPRTIKIIQEALDYYESKKQNLALCNTGFTTRSEYTAEIPD